MILHLLTDEKFTDYVLKQFSSPELVSDFVIVSYSSHLHYITLDTGIRIVHPNTKDFNDLIDHLNDYQAIVLHGLFWSWESQILKRVPATVKVAWVFWGGDIYGRKEFDHLFLSPSSKLLDWLHGLSRGISRKRTEPSYEIPISLLRRIDFCLTDVHEDFVFVKEYLESNIQEIWYNYYSIEETLGELASSSIKGHNVLVGNSCFLECNHLYGFRLLRRLNLGDSKVVVPLSYGEKWLKSRLLPIGRLFFGHRFYPIHDFMPRKEYNQILQSCAVVVMPHFRPQAFGNILTALWLGARVYLSERNLLYAYFRRIGAIVFSIEKELRKTNSQVLSPLSEAERQQNRITIKNLYSKDFMYQRNLELVRVLNQ